MAWLLLHFFSTTTQRTSFKPFISIPVSHTTDDMIFQWDPEVPLVVGDDIELPQLALIQNQTADCTQVWRLGRPVE
jgi:hypothetical protein